MKYKKIKFLNHEEEFISPDELNKELQEQYKYPLLNFAFVIAEVLDGLPPFSKIILGRKITAMKKEIDDLEIIKQRVIKDLESHAKKHFQSDISDDYTIEVLKMLLIQHLNLTPFFESINNFKGVLDEFKPLFKRGPLTSEFLPLSQPISCAYQISFLWAIVMSNKYVHWLNIQSFLAWFLYHFDGSAYEKKLEFPREKDGKKIGANIDILKNAYMGFKSLYGFHSLLYRLIYFPSRTKRPFFPKPGAKDIEEPEGHFPIISIKFYKNKIKTILEVEGKLKVRETKFERGKPESAIRDYEKREEKKDGSALLLEID